MLNAHLVKCRQFGCHWSGLLSPNCAADSTGEFVHTGTIVVFQCPCCQQEWRARVLGGRVKPLPMDDVENGLEWMMWPPLEIGVGD
jgi:hypothetical protein